MRLAVSHLVTCRLSTSANGTAQTVRMEPRGFAGQFVETWRLDVSGDCLLKPVTDPYGNVTYTFALAGPLDAVTFQASGIVSTEDTIGVVNGVADRLPHALYRRDTPLTKPTEPIRALAATVASQTGANALDRLHGLMHHLSDNLTVTPSTARAAPCLGAPVADAVLAAGSGDDVDLAHLFTAAARALGLPARVVTGYIFEPTRPQPATAVAIWAEVWVAGIGWIGFDVPRRTCPTEAYIRLAAGPDLRDAQPLRLAAYGAELVEVTTAVSMVEKPLW